MSILEDGLCGHQSHHDHSGAGQIVAEGKAVFEIIVWYGAMSVEDAGGQAAADRYRLQFLVIVAFGVNRGRGERSAY